MVKELEIELKNGERTVTQLQSDPGSSLIQSPDKLLDPMDTHQGGQRHWQGLWTPLPKENENRFFGPSSSSHFLVKLGNYIDHSLQLSNLNYHISPSGASMFLASPTVARTDLLAEYPTATDGLVAFEDISRSQEESFLGLFWQSYHCTIPILNELEFKEYYESLWPAPSSAVRQPSPLVDIVLALCMQYGMTFVPRNEASQGPVVSFDSDDSTVAGRAFYRRCQTLISTKMEQPNIMTLQCLMFSAVYLRNASFKNMAHNTLGLAIRTAHTLGLHQEPRDHSPRAQKELHRRLWWIVYAMDTAACMACGPPWLAQMSQVACALPADDRELALSTGPSFASSIDGITWLSYHVQIIKLNLAARAVQIAFDRKCTQVLTASNEESFHGNPQILEVLAEFLLKGLLCLRSWAYDVPLALKNERREGGKPFSTDRSALQLDSEAPQWLQRQRLLLELAYHSLMMNLYRPFINFARPPSSSTPLADGNSISCLNHAVASTNIIVQVLKGTDILSGWHDVYELQWDATLTMVGFIFANPVCPPTPTARKTINIAIDVFEIFSNNFAVAASATAVTRDLAVKVDTFLDRFRKHSGSTQQTPISATPTTMSWMQDFRKAKTTNVDALPHENSDGNSVMDQRIFTGAMDLDFSSEPYVGPDGLEWSSPQIDITNNALWPQFVNGP